MVRRALIMLCFGFMTVFMASCGQTYKLQSISISPAAGYSLSNAVPQGALTVKANYSNTKTSDVTANSSYQMIASALNNTTAPLNAVEVNKSGVVTASGSVLACTWASSTSGGTTTYTPAPYLAQVSFTDNGITATASVPIHVVTAPGCDGQ